MIGKQNLVHFSYFIFIFSNGCSIASVFFLQNDPFLNVFFGYFGMKKIILYPILFDEELKLMIKGLCDRNFLDVA